MWPGLRAGGRARGRSRSRPPSRGSGRASRRGGRPRSPACSSPSGCACRRPSGSSVGAGRWWRRARVSARLGQVDAIGRQPPLEPPGPLRHPAGLLGRRHPGRQPDLQRGAHEAGRRTSGFAWHCGSRRTSKRWPGRAGRGRSGPIRLRRLGRPQAWQGQRAPAPRAGGGESGHQGVVVNVAWSSAKGNSRGPGGELESSSFGPSRSKNRPPRFGKARSTSWQ